jgi:hypothetical protein
MKFDGERLPRIWLRAWAWILGALAFFGPLAVLGISPKPAGAEAQPAPAPEPKPRRVIHRVIRRVVITQAAPIQVAPAVNYVSGGSSFSGGGGSSGGTSAAPVSGGS